MNTNKEPQFKLGDPVRKVTGEYHLDGVIVAVFWNTSGALRYVVEHQPLAPGLLHIYSEKNLAPRES